MKPFHFSLELVRTLRQQKEQAAQQHYAAALTACQAAELQLQAAMDALAAVWHSLGKEMRQGITADRIAEIQGWCEVLETRWNDSQTAVESARRAAEQAFQALSIAARGREALDRFHDKSRRAHERACVREEQKTIDELAVQLNSAPGPLQTNHCNP